MPKVDKSQWQALSAGPLDVYVHYQGLARGRIELSTDGASVIEPAGAQETINTAHFVVQATQDLSFRLDLFVENASGSTGVELTLQQANKILACADADGNAFNGAPPASYKPVEVDELALATPDTIFFALFLP